MKTMRCMRRRKAGLLRWRSEGIAPTVVGVMMVLAAPDLVNAQTPGEGQTPPARSAAEVAERIARVEAGLLPVTVRAGAAESRRRLEDRMRELGVPAVSVAVVSGGRIEWAKAWGAADREGELAADTATLFQAASISKPVAAIGVLRLVREGRLELDGDVNGWLKSWRLPANGFTAREKVTLRRLLSHSAGTTVHGFGGYAAGSPLPTVVQVLDGAGPANSAAVRVDTVPGAMWRYSGGGTTIVQLMMTDATGAEFTELMRTLVLEPVGMRRSTYAQPLPVSARPFAATGYRSDGRAVAGGYHTYPEQAAAGLWTTPSDLARLAIEVQRALRGESALLDREMAEEMLRPESGEYGIGFAVSGDGDARIFSHTGSNAGFRASFLAYARRGEAVVVMTNSDAGGGLAGEIARAVADVYGWPSPRPSVAGGGGLPLP